MFRVNLNVFFFIVLLFVANSFAAPTPAVMPYPMGYGMNMMPVSSQMPMNLRPNRIFYDAIGNWINQQSWLPFEVNIPDAINNVASNVQIITNGIIQRIPFLNRNPGYLRPENDGDEFIHQYVIIPPYHHHHFHPWHLHHYFRNAEGIKMPIQMANVKSVADVKSVDQLDVEGTLQVEKLQNSDEINWVKNNIDKSTQFIGLDVGNGLFVESVFNEIPVFYP